ncbi:MAG: hypothetical protein IT318_26670 [Anaerolineales bacterium]|nr:hypothetical protein [Anaerolineales bacterium]
MRPIVLRLALLSLALATANLGSILAAYAVYCVALRPAPQLVIQAALAAGLSIAAFVGWYWLVEQVPTNFVAVWLAQRVRPRTSAACR